MKNNEDKFQFLEYLFIQNKSDDDILYFLSQPENNVVVNCPHDKNAILLACKYIRFPVVEYLCNSFLECVQQISLTNGYDSLMILNQSLTDILTSSFSNNNFDDLINQNKHDKLINDGFKIAELLINKGIDLNYSTSNRCFNIIHDCLSTNNITLLTLIMKQEGLDLNIVNEFGMTRKNSLEQHQQNFPKELKNLFIGYEENWNKKYLERELKMSNYKKIKV